MAHNYNTGYAVVDSDPNGITTLQSGHSMKLAVNQTTNQVWKFLPGNNAGEKWVQVEDNFTKILEIPSVTVTTPFPSPPGFPPPPYSSLEVQIKQAVVDYINALSPALTVTERENLYIIVGNVIVQSVGGGGGS